MAGELVGAALHLLKHMRRVVRTCMQAGRRHEPRLNRAYSGDRS